MSSQSASYGLQYHARSIAAQEGEQGASCWLVGTSVTTEVNEVQLLQLDNEKDRLTALRTFDHPHEIWSISASPSDSQLFATVYTEGSGFGASLWSIPSEGRELQKQADLSSEKRTARAAVWSPEDSSLIALVSEQTVAVQRIGDGGPQVAHQIGGDQGSFSGPAAWSRKDASQFATSSSENIQVWDIRTTKAATAKEAAHASTIRCLDYAYSDGHLLASSGDDCRVKIWDTRLFKTPLINSSEHAHWVWQCKFSPSYAQMLLTASSDATVKLHQIPRLAKPSAKPTPAHAPGSQQWQSSEASVAAVFDTHDDSVYGVAWSHVNPWVFASLSYDGRVIIGRVPSNVKYSILI